MEQKITEMYGSLVFGDKVMRDKLPKDIYKALRKTIDKGTHLELDVANAVAIAMKEWAVDNGATHYITASSVFVMPGGRRGRQCSGPRHPGIGTTCHRRFHAQG